MPKNERARGFVFTVNNPLDGREDAIIEALQTVCQYCIIGRERGANGTPHLQGYVYFANPKGFERVVELLGNPRAHVEKARGSPIQNREYCSKDGNFRELGELPRQGRRKDLEIIQQDICAGASEKQIADSYFSTWIVYRRSFKEYRKLIQSQPRREKSVVVWIHGPTGSGKTRGVYSEMYKFMEFLVSPRSDPEFTEYRNEVLAVAGGHESSTRSLWTSVDACCKWFDGYDQHREVIMDDFRGESDLALLLRLLDRYPMEVPVKGGFTNWNPYVIYITSNFTPRECYSTKDIEHLRPLFRRIDLFVEKPTLDGPFVDVTQSIRF